MSREGKKGNSQKEGKEGSEIVAQRRRPGGVQDYRSENRRHEAGVREGMTGRAQLDKSIAARDR